MKDPSNQKLPRPGRRRLAVVAAAAVALGLLPQAVRALTTFNNVNLVPAGTESGDLWVNRHMTIGSSAGNLNIGDNLGGYSYLSALIGYYNNAYVGLAVGYYNDAVGGNSMAIGTGNYAYGTNSVAFGTSSSASGNSSFASGMFTIASGASAVSFGYYSKAEGENSLSMGEFTSTVGDSSVAGGEYSHAEGDNSFAFGTNSVAVAHSAFVVGRYAEIDLNENPNAWEGDETAFAVGIGTDVLRRNALTVYQNGTIIMDKPQGDLEMGNYGNPNP